MQNKTQKKPDLNLQRHENVPIYRTARELLMGTRQVVSRMDKIFKYDMGADLTNGAKRLLRWAFLTYEEQDNLHLKLAYLRKVRVAAQDLMIDHRVANYIKHTLKTRWYVRYVDDAVLVSRDREELADWCAAIDAWLKTHRALSLHPNKIHIGPLSQGVEFVGRLILPYRTYTRKMTAHAAKQAARRLRKHPADDKAMCSVNSYLGLLRQADTYNLRAALCKQVCFPLITGTDENCNKVSKLWK